MNLDESNFLQIFLIKESSLDTENWILTYSSKFREIVEGGVSKIEDIKFFLYNN
ncbi:hypothetical protein [Haliovirga abyssi]|uniref:Uncharacterized protein n=1 Tax=Haliovirga abyssi TaxID=2996794 RepID=A0AAU9D4A4_9FUSO|nr:hypothetical protein [Haliovirga abyssi]BDU50816.1 hypothetical protein HLVA_13850 [Haliovirga abyssi]